MRTCCDNACACDDRSHLPAGHWVRVLACIAVVAGLACGGSDGPAVNQDVVPHDGDLAVPADAATTDDHPGVPDAVSGDNPADAPAPDDGIPSVQACRDRWGDCDDNDPCTTDACDLEDGCLHVTIDPGEACDDDDPCTVDDRCDALHACAGSPRVCDDSNDCTADSCDAAQGGCRFDPVDGACDDGDPCTAGEQCAAGKCGGGADVFGCCVADDACDDGDACTVESCDLGTNACRYDGETTAVCGASGACEGAFCRGETGACETFGRGMPHVLLAWDLRGALPPAGFRWTASGGTLGPDGAVATASAGPDGTAFRLPGRRLPGGVIVLHADLGADTACNDVAIRVTGADITADHRGCGTDATGRRVLAASWNVADGAIADVEVRMKTGNVVAGVTVFAWAGVDCRPLDPVVVAEGFDIGAYGFSGDRTAAVGAFFTTDDVSVLSTDLAGTSGAAVVDDPATYVAAAARVASLPLADGRFLLAYGPAAKGGLTLVLADRTGAVIAIRPYDVMGASEQQSEPALFLGPDGAARIVWTSSLGDGNGRDIRLARIDVTGDQIGPYGVPEFVNVAMAQDQHAPAVWYENGDGMVAFVTDLVKREVRVRRLDATGLPTGAEVVVATPAVAIDRLALVGAGDKRFLAWEAGKGDVVGQVFDSAGENGSSFSFTEQVGSLFQPAMGVVSGTPVLVVLRQIGANLRVVASKVSADGKVSSASSLSDFVLSNAFPAVHTNGAFAFWFGYYDEVTNPRALRIGLASPFCGSGPVMCPTAATPAVCVGFGATGYEAVSGATWCP